MEVPLCMNFAPFCYILSLNDGLGGDEVARIVSVLTGEMNRAISQGMCWGSQLEIWIVEDVIVPRK